MHVSGFIFVSLDQSNTISIIRIKQETNSVAKEMLQAFNRKRVGNVATCKYCHMYKLFSLFGISDFQKYLYKLKTHLYIHT